MVTAGTASHCSDAGIGHAPREIPSMQGLILHWGVPWRQLTPQLSQCCCLLLFPLVSCRGGRLLCLRGGDCAVPERGQHPLPPEVSGAALVGQAHGKSPGFPTCPSVCRTPVFQGNSKGHWVQQDRLCLGSANILTPSLTDAARSSGARIMHHRQHLLEGVGRFPPPMCSTVHPRYEGRHSAVATAPSLPASCLLPFALQEWIHTLPSLSRGILVGGLIDGGCSTALILPSYWGAASHAEPSESITAEDRLRERRAT